MDLMRNLLNHPRVRFFLNWGISGILYLLSLPPYNLFPLGWIALVPALVETFTEGEYRVLFGGILWGAIVWGIGTDWFWNFHPVAFILAVPTLIFVSSTVFFITNIFSKYLYRWKTLLLIAVWISFDFSRSVGYLIFPWFFPAHTQWNFPLVTQIVDLFGIWGLSATILAINSIIADWIIKKRFFWDLEKVIVITGLVFTVIYGSIVLNFVKFVDTNRPFKVALLQHNLNPWDRWWDIHWKRYSEVWFLSANASLELPDLLLASESMIRNTVLDDYKYYPKGSEIYLFAERVLKLPKELKVDFVLTSPILHGETQRLGYYVYQYYNSAYLITKEGEIKGIYKKIHPVPGAEYVPFLEIIPPLRKLVDMIMAGDVIPGKDFVIFKHEKNIFFSVIICFEDLLPDLVREFVRRGAEVLLNTTNDGWARSIKSQRQHLAFASFRAIENRRFLLRATNTGTTALIDPYGIVRKTLPDYTRDYLVCEIYPSNYITLYSIIGDILPLFSLISLSLFILLFGYLKNMIINDNIF